MQSFQEKIPSLNLNLSFYNLEKLGLKQLESSRWNDVASKLYFAKSFTGSYVLNL